MVVLLCTESNVVRLVLPLRVTLEVGISTLMTVRLLSSRRSVSHTPHKVIGPMAVVGYALIDKG